MPVSCSVFVICCPSWIKNESSQQMLLARQTSRKCIQGSSTMETEWNDGSNRRVFATVLREHTETLTTKWHTQTCLDGYMIKDILGFRGIVAEGQDAVSRSNRILKFSINMLPSSSRVNMSLIFQYVLTLEDDRSTQKSGIDYSVTKHHIPE